jgi:DnaJ-domain-containing protein 1
MGRTTPRSGQIPRRRHRYATHGLACELGQVLDLSADGMKIGCRGKPGVARGEVMQFSIRSAAQKIAVVGRVVWTRRTSWREHRIGIQFLDVKPPQGDALEELAQHGFISGRRRGANFTMGGDLPPISGRLPVRALVEIEDLYKILGVRRDADVHAIRAAYRAAARMHHPDVSADPDAEKKFTLISKAYSVLSDDDRRRRYDELLARAA